MAHEAKLELRVHIDEFLDLVVIVAQRQHFVDQELQREVTRWLLKIGLDLVLKHNLISICCPLRLFALDVHSFN